MGNMACAKPRQNTNPVPDSGDILYLNVWCRYRDSHNKEKAVVRPYYLCHGNSNAGKTAFYIGTAAWFYEYVYECCLIPFDLVFEYTMRSNIVNIKFSASDSETLGPFKKRISIYIYIYIYIHCQIGWNILYILDCMGCIIQTTFPRYMYYACLVCNNGVVRTYSRLLRSYRGDIFVVRAI